MFVHDFYQNRRVAALKEKESSQPKAKGKEKVPVQYQKLDKPDRDIAMRLEKLKEAKKPKGMSGGRISFYRILLSWYNE